MYARIAAGVVAELIAETDTPIADRFHPDLLAAMVPVPQGVAVQPGWTVAGGVFAPPAAPAPAAPIRAIRALAFRERLAEARRVAITLASHQAAAAGNAQLLAWLMDQAASTSTDLDDPRTQAGNAGLLAAGAISQAERDALLANGNPSET